MNKFSKKFVVTNILYKLVFIETSLSKEYSRKKPTPTFHHPLLLDVEEMS